ncbi:hypothetical protein [Lysobacter gummosus]|uniref:hypothetical protein n=1 Tax=Lysobacter gummosus TaxID=262324 RepID=UPI00362A83A3
MNLKRLAPLCVRPWPPRRVRVAMDSLKAPQRSRRLPQRRRSPTAGDSPTRVPSRSTA